MHHPEIKGSGQSHWADCPECGGKVAGENGPVVGSFNKVDAAVKQHQEETKDTP